MYPFLTPLTDVQLVKISGGSGGGIITTMTSSLLSVLLGGDNSKYPVTLDFSVGYQLSYDTFLASCPDIIRE